ncbi:MAG TPA: 16S rRNA (cytidine(1402)-2'-O)-methyltransferase [Vicinamibacterales bacterium]|nr:16S rRNA (cytidine(1402)-2'-O)-methyltransferase [Vicinamibacterales bacterium]
MPGTLFVVATPIGNLEDITMRALRVLRDATVIAAEDTRRTSHLLARYAIATPTTSLHEHNEGRKAAAIVQRLIAGESVALVSDAGTPTISDPGQQLIHDAIAAGIRIEPVPGPNAAIATLAVSGFNTEVFTFLGFPPVRSKDRREWFKRISSLGPIVVFYEAPHRIRRTLADLQAAIGDCNVTVGRELTKIHEELVRGPISTVLDRLPEPKGEFTVVADVGQTTDNVALAAPPDADIFAEFGESTNNRGASRRQALAFLAEKYRMAPNDIYAAIERAKKSVE